MAAEKTPAVVNEAQRILDLVKKLRPGTRPGPAAPPPAAPGKPSPTR